MRPILAFQVDQGTPGGLAANFGPGKPAGPMLGNVWDALSPLRGKYDVCLLLTPVFPDWAVLLALLDTVAGMGAAYALDVLSSDNISLRITPWHAPYDCAHGISLPVQQIISLRQRHGGSFVGMRAHEMITMGWMIEEGRAGRLDWWNGFMDLAPTPGGFFRRELCEPFLSYARGQGMWVSWSEPRWDAYAGETVRLLTDEFPGAVVPTYANNVEGLGVEATYWNELKPALTGNARGWGLSDQSWADGNPAGDPRLEPADVLARWAREALGSGASLVEFEPGGYFFNLPVVWEPLAPRHDGRGTPALQTLLGALAGA